MLFWFGIGLGRLETPQDAAATCVPLRRSGWVGHRVTPDKVNLRHLNGYLAAAIRKGQLTPANAHGDINEFCGGQQIKKKFAAENFLIAASDGLLHSTYDGI